MTQSRHAASICSTNASLSGLSEPWEPYESGFTTGVSQPSGEKCAAFENAEEAAELVELDADSDGDGDDEEEDEDEDDEESVMRQRSAKGR